MDDPARTRISSRTFGLPEEIATEVHRLLPTLRMGALPLHLALSIILRCRSGSVQHSLLFLCSWTQS